MKLHWASLVLLLAGSLSLPADLRAAPERKSEAASKAVAPHGKSTNLSERRKQKNEAEQKRAELQAQLSRLKQEIDHTEAAKDSAADTLAAAEDAISAANASLE